MARSPLTYVVSAVAAAMIGVTSWAAWGNTPDAAAPNQEGIVDTQWGPLGPADRDLLVRVRLAGLWEHPVGHDMAQRATQPKAKDVGEKISTEHQQLNQITDDTAKKLGVALPSQPLPDQKGWMDQVAKATGPDVGKLAVNLMRKSHGSILPQILKVRADTRNSLMRPFAEQAATFVQRHINYLESTGLVDYDALPQATPTESGDAVVTRAGAYEISPDGLPGIAIFVIIASILAVIVCLVLVRRRSQPSPEWSDDDPTPMAYGHRLDGGAGNPAQPYPAHPYGDRHPRR